MSVNTNTDTLVKLGDTDLQLADPIEDVRGRKIVDRAGEAIGHVDALLIDQRDRKVRFLRVASGGFLGIGERTFLIPVDAVTRVQPNEVRIDQTRQHLVGAPAYDPSLVLQQDYYAGLSGYFGYRPYWSPGYVYPLYPYYQAERAATTRTARERAGAPIAGMSDPAVDAKLNQIHHGMRVVDANGETIGHVDYMKMGDPGAVTVDSVTPPAPGLWGSAIGGGEPDVPEPLRSRLLRQGYVKVDGKGWIDVDRYVPADEIAGIAGDTVTLTVDKNHLVNEM
jgi:sporulation protein YlmC with PRC-barrel domain